MGYNISCDNLTTQITNTVLSLWQTGRKTKHTPSGWISGNAPCCIHNGEKHDTRGRGGLLIKDGSFQWHCFNCNFKAGYSQGKLFSKNTRSLLSWLGMSDADIGKLNLVALAAKDSALVFKPQLDLELTVRPLPDDCMSIDDWITHGCTDPELLAVIDYIVTTRKMSWDWYNWHWSSANGYRDRVILPFYQGGKIVGYTGRKITKGKPKYLTDAQPGYVFNIDRQSYSRSCVIVVEGQFDAIAVDGVAIMSNEVSDAQALRINALSRTVIVVPDRDRAGAMMVKCAIEQGWSVSLPPWEEHIKDTAQATETYGRVYTLASILEHQESNTLKLQLLQKKLENIKND